MNVSRRVFISWVIASYEIRILRGDGGFVLMEYGC